MKLIEILLKHDFEFTNNFRYVTQDDDGRIFQSTHAPNYDDTGTWESDVTSYQYQMFKVSDCFYFELADDYHTSVIVKEFYDTFKNTFKNPQTLENPEISEASTLEPEVLDSSNYKKYLEVEEKYEEYQKVQKELQDKIKAYNAASKLRITLGNN